MLLLLVVGNLPISFAAVFKSSIWVDVGFVLTESAGKLGTIVIIVVTSYCYTIRVESKRKKLLMFLKSFVAVSLFIGALAFVNEYLTKPLLKEVRPSHQYIANQLGANNQLDSVYQLTKTQRKYYFEQCIQNNKTYFNNVDAKVLHHWIEEAGYSFPSGHSFNAYLLATIMAFSLYHATNKKWNKYYWIPFLWASFVALSRVAIGAHTAIDVTIGSLGGFTIAAVFIYFDTTRKLIIYKKL
jgi:phosphatidylglycerophosphatase B